MAEHVCTVFPGADTLGTVNMEITPEGATPAFDHGAMTGSADALHYWGAPIETKNPSGNPRQYVFANDDVYYYQDGALTLDKDFDDVLQGLLLFGANAAGTVTKRLIAFFGSSTTGSLAGGGHAWRNLGTDTTPWAYHVGATAVQGWLAANFGPDAMVVTGNSGAGRTVLGEHNLSKIVQGLYDGTTTNIGPGEPIGNGDWPVIGLAALRNSFAAGIGAGAFIRNTVDKIYEPIRPLQEKLPHGLNNKAMASGENSVIYSTNDGRLFEYGGSGEREITPLRMRGKPKDTQRGRISFIAHRGDILAVGYEVGQSYLIGPRAAAIGMRAFTKIAGTWAEITTDVTDGSLATPSAANMNAWGGTATDRLLITSPVPLAGIIPRVTRNPNGNNNAFTNPQGSSTAANTGGSLPTDMGTIIDNTILAVSGRSLVLTGFPPAAAEQLLWGDSISITTDVGKTSLLTLTGLTTIADVYAYEFSPVNTTAMSTTATIDEIDAILARPGLKLDDTSGPFVAANDFSALKDSGMLTEVYFGTPSGGGYEWANPYTLFTKAGGILAAAWHSGPGGALDNGGQKLLLYGRSGQYQIAEGQTRDPRRTRYPRLCQWTTTEPGPTLSLNDVPFRESNGNLADPSKPKRISKVTVYGEDFQPADMFKPLVNYRHGRGWHKFATQHGTLPKTSVDVGTGKGGGRRANMKLLVSDTNQTDLWAPLCSRVDITWEYIEEQVQPAPAETVAVE